MSLACLGARLSKKTTVPPPSFNPSSLALSKKKNAHSLNWPVLPAPASLIRLDHWLEQAYTPIDKANSVLHAYCTLHHPSLPCPALPPPLPYSTVQYRVDYLLLPLPLRSDADVHCRQAGRLATLNPPSPPLTLTLTLHSCSHCSSATTLHYTTPNYNTTLLPPSPPESQSTTNRISPSSLFLHP